MTLLQLPPELLSRIASYLTTPELGDLRRSCKHVEAALFDGFAREFFTKRQFMIEHVSLQALVDIANHPTLSLRLSEVIIGTQTLPPDSDYISKSASALYKSGHVSRDVLLETGQAHNMLVEAFSKLPNLQTVGLRDYEARGRYRDGDNASWRSYGWSHFNLQRELEAGSFSLSPFQSNQLAKPESLLPLIFYALGCAQVAPVNIHVFLRKRPKLTPTAFNILDGYMGRKIVPILHDMKEVMLALGLTTMTRFGRPGSTYDDNNMTEAPLKRFLHHTPNLETLRINFEPEQYFANRFLNWLGKPVTDSVGVQNLLPTSSPVPPVSLANLTSLELGMLNVAAPVLLNTITKFNLKTLSLWKCSLHCADIHEFRQSPDRWEQFFHDLSETLPASTQLTSVMIGYVSQVLLATDYNQELRVQFAASEVSADGKRKDRTGLLDRITHRAGVGTSIRDWFSSLSKRTVLEVVSSGEEDSDSDDHVSDMDIDDDEEDDESEGEGEDV